MNLIPEQHGIIITADIFYWVISLNKFPENHLESICNRNYSSL